MKSNADILKEFKARKAITERGLALQIENSALCDAFYDGDYMSYKSDLVTKNIRKSVEFNKVQPYVNSVAGFMIQTRTKAKYYPNIQDQMLRPVYLKTTNSLANYVRENGRFNQVESQQDLQLLIKGYGATETDMTYGEGYATTDPNGEIIMDDVTYDIRWDPMARKKNLLDRRYNYYKKSFMLDDAKTLFDESDEDDFDEMRPDNGLGYEYDPTLGGNYDRSREMPSGPYEWDSKDNKTVWVTFYEWCETEKFYRADNPVYNLTNPLAIQAAMLTMDAIEADTEQEDSLFKFDGTAKRLTFDQATKKKLEDAFGEYIQPYAYNRKVYYKAILSGNKVFKAYRQIGQQGFSVKFKTGIWNNTKKIWVGMVNAMMEPVRYFCKGLTEMMYMIATNSKGGWFVEEGATDDIRAFENNVNRTNAVVKLNAGGLAAIREKKTPVSMSGYDQIVALSDANISDSSGINKEFLMSQSLSGNMTAQLHRQVIKQVMSTLAPYFDAREAYQEEHARMLIDYLRVYAENNEGLVIRIAGPQGSEEFMQISQDPFTAEYDVKVEETPDTEEELQQQIEMLISMGDKLMAVGDVRGIQFYVSAINKMKLDDEDKQRLSATLEPQEDPRIAQLQAQVAQLTNDQTQASTALIKAQTDKLMADTQKSAADVQETAANIAKKASETDQITLETHLAATQQPLVSASI